MEINLVAVGDRMPDWVAAGFNEYARRVRGRCRLKLIEVPARNRPRNADLSRIVEQEGVQLLKAAPRGSRLIALDRGGRQFSTEQLANKMDDWLQTGQPISLLVGGPEGFSAQVLEEVDESWSLSSLTFAHPLVRVIAAEQLYRAWSILESLPYHR